MSTLLFAVFNGLAAGAVIFMVAAGVTLIFGILKVLNFAHGSFFMVGAYVCWSITGDNPTSLARLGLGSLVGGLVVCALGWLTEKVVLQRLRGADYHYVMISTFALMLVVTGVVKLVWGQDFHAVNPPPELSGATALGEIVVSHMSVFLILLGSITFVLLDVVVHRTWVGKLLQSVVRDPWIVSVLGYNVNVLHTATVMAACFLAGLAGGALLPNQSLSPGLADAYILVGFIACILGGLGNVRGAFVASLLLGLVDSLSVVFLRAMPGLAIYVAMVLVLLLRPQGLFASTDSTGGTAAWSCGLPWSHSSATRNALRQRLVAQRSPPSAPAAPGRTGPAQLKTPALLPVLAVGAIVVGSMPLWAPRGLVFTAGIALIEGLFALSWHFLFRSAGLVSFGHAAFYAIGAYAVAVSLKVAAPLPFPLLLVLVACGGGLVAGIIGLLTLKRSSGIYFAILTLALAEVCRILVSSTTKLGADDGISSIPRPTLGLGEYSVSLAADNAYFWFLCVIVAAVIAGVWWVSHSSFGRVLDSLHQDPERTAFLGINVDWYRLRAFMVSGAVAALAGGLAAPWTQIVSPEVASVVHSTNAVLNALLGGMGSFWGAFAGSAAFAAIAHATRTLTGVYEITIGSILMLVVLLAPFGILGAIRPLRAHLLGVLAAIGTRRRAKAMPEAVQGKERTT